MPHRHSLAGGHTNQRHNGRESLIPQVGIPAHTARCVESSCAPEGGGSGQERCLGFQGGRRHPEGDMAIEWSPGLSVVLKRTATITCTSKPREFLIGSFFRQPFRPYPPRK